MTSLAPASQPPTCDSRCLVNVYAWTHNERYLRPVTCGRRGQSSLDHERVRSSQEDLSLLWTLRIGFLRPRSYRIEVTEPYKRISLLRITLCSLGLTGFARSSCHLVPSSLEVDQGLISRFGGTSHWCRDQLSSGLGNGYRFGRSLHA